MKYPKIGIRPIIDGRLGGMRESLEDTTMEMAIRLAALLNLFTDFPSTSLSNATLTSICT